MKGKKVFIGIIFVLIVVISVVSIAIVGNKLPNKSNEYSTIFGYFDEERQYVSSMELTYKLETEETYSETIKLRDNKDHTIFISENELSHDITVQLKDSNSNVICTQTVKKGQSKVYLGESRYAGGEYKLDISLPKNCEGTLEIQIDE